MNIVIGTVLLWAIVVPLWRRLPSAGRRADALQSVRNTLAFTLPRMVVALVGAGFFAELMPEDQVEALFGEGSGLGALLLAAALGPVTPGGPFVAFAIGAAALAAGAAPAPVLTYVTSWSLFSLMRVLAYELPILGGRTTLVRCLVTLPVPVAIGAITAALPL